jgi:hypothetical protein
MAQLTAVGHQFTLARDNDDGGTRILQNVCKLGRLLVQVI